MRTIDIGELTLIIHEEMKSSFGIRRARKIADRVLPLINARLAVAALPATSDPAAPQGQEDLEKKLALAMNNGLCEMIDGNMKMDTCRVTAHILALPEFQTLLRTRAPDPTEAAKNRYVDIVFDGPPSHESGRFVEVEDERGHGLKFGEWIQRPNGYWALRIPAPPAKPSVEDIARVIRRAMLDNLTDVNFTVRAERRERLADDYAREIHALFHGAGGMEDRS